MKSRNHHPGREATPAVVIVPDAFDAANGAKTPFGRRWGGDIFRLSAEQFNALQSGQTLALDVQNEYIAFLKCAESVKQEQAINSFSAASTAEAILRGPGNGG